MSAHEIVIGIMAVFALLGAALGAALILFVLLPPLRRMEGLLHRAGKRIMTALAQNRLLKVIFK